MSWPHNDDGTVDWDTVFDDPDIGLTAFVARAKTVMALGQCAHVIVQSLFIREEDGPHRQAFNLMVDEIIASTTEQDADHARDVMLKLIGEIKANRVRHAQHYLDNAEPNIDDRRREGVDHTEALQALKEMSGPQD